MSTRLESPAQAGQQVVGGHRRRRLVALPEEDHAEQDQDDAGDQGADDQAAAGQAGHALGAARGDPDAGPVDDDDDRRGPHAAAGELGVEHVGERARHEPEQARVVEDRHRELAPHRQEAHRLGDALRDPVVDAALPARRQLRGDQRGRQQEHDRREQVEEDAGQAVDGHGRRRPQAGHRAGGHHRQGDPRDPLRCWRRGCVRRRPAPAPSAGTSAALMTFLRCDASCCPSVPPPLESVEPCADPSVDRQPARGPHPRG